MHKPEGWTSFDIVKKIRSITKEKKVGHGGTLDPFAEGVLIIGTGRDTKNLSKVTDQKKRYQAIIKLGSQTDTLDTEGRVVNTMPVPLLNRKELENI